MIRKNKIFVLILLMIPILIFTIKNYKILETSENHTTSPNKINKINSIFTKENVNVFNDLNIIFFIDFEDFSCLPCENQVIYLCKWMEENMDIVINNKVLLFVRNRNNNEQYYKFIISNWIKENKINFQVKLDSNYIFTRLGVSNTSIAILDRNSNNIKYYNNFPLTPVQLEKVKKLLIAY